MATGNLIIISNPISAQYEAVRDSEVVGLLAYNKVGDHVDLRHTFVRKDLRGQQIGHLLVAEALRMIRSEGHIITASCSYVAKFIEQHPEFAHLLDEQPVRTSWNASVSVRRVTTGEARSDTENVYPDGITTARLALRPWTLDDAEDAFRVYADADGTRWSRPSIPPVADLSMMRRRLDEWIRQSDHLPRPQGRWAVELTHSGSIVGGAHLLALREQGESRMVMSWELDRTATGADLDAEVGHALAHSAFSIDPDLVAVYAFADLADERALDALYRIGMRALPGAEHRVDAGSVRFSISRDDLHARRNEFVATS
jgi:predicted GNAT family acetyltransferase/RimJ/RimL family protein N-acetyltransferase